MAGRAIATLLASPGLAMAQERVRAIHEATRNTLVGAIGVRLRQLFGGPPQPFKPYPDAPRTALPAADATPGSPLSAVLEDIQPVPTLAPQSISLPLLVRLLEAANGVTGRSPGGIELRAAPSAGALYAGELYVLAESVEGLARGLYYYAPLSRELVLLREGSQLETVTGALEAPQRAGGAAAAVLVTSVFPRYRWRYANRGYRYGLVDVGHIGQNLLLATASSGLADWSPDRFHDDRLNDLLDVDGLDEAVCAVHLIGARGKAPADAGRTHPLVEAGAAGRPLPESADDVPERYHAWTRLVPAAERGPTPPSSPAGTSSSNRPAQDAAADADATGDEQVVRLARHDGARSAGISVEEAIRRRRSARAFAQAPIDGEDLGLVLAAAIGPEPLRRAPVSLFVFVHRGRGIAPGLYRARRGAQGVPELTALQSGDLSERLVDVCLGQEKAGQAAAGIAMVGELETAAEAAGERGYRDLCLEAGAIGQRIYLAAESAGIAARNLSAFVDERLNELVGVDGRRRAVLHLTMLGPGD